MALTIGGKRRPGGFGPRTPLDPLEQALTERLASVMRALAGKMDLDAYVRAIEALDPDLLEQQLAAVNVAELGKRLEDVMRQVIISGGSAEAERIMRETPRPGVTPAVALQYRGVELPSGFIVPESLRPPQVGFTIASERPDMFKFIDQRAVDYARYRSASLVTSIDQSNRLAIRQVITKAFTDPATVDQTARRLRQVVGLHPRWATAVQNFDDVNYRRLLREGLTVEAARAKADVLTERYRAKLIRRRSEMIARTEIQQAQNYARQAAWDAGERTGYVDSASLKEWSTAPSTSSYGPPCPICAELKGKRVPWNGAFPNGQLTPPAHPHCRCTAVLVPPSRGLQGLPSQDMASWLDRLDALDEEMV